MDHRIALQLAPELPIERQLLVLKEEGIQEWVRLRFLVPETQLPALVPQRHRMWMGSRHLAVCWGPSTQSCLESKGSATPGKTGWTITLGLRCSKDTAISRLTDY